METLRVHDDRGVRVVLLDRPEALNALNQQMMDDLADVFFEAATDESVRGLVLTGAGQAFSAGADLVEMGTKLPAPKHGLRGMLEAIVDFSKPLFVAINGVGAGFGATITGLADFTFIAESARLRCPFSALGVVPELGSTVTFPARMGRQRANWFLMSSEWMDAAKCVEAGLALEMLPDDELMSAVMARAHELAALPLASVMRIKHLTMDPIRPALRETIRAENRALDETIGGPANLEALAAFRENRDPDFSGM